MSDEEIIADAKSMHPGMEFGVVRNGMNVFFQLTRVVQLWKDEQGYLDGYKPLATIEGYPR